MEPPELPAGLGKAIGSRHLSLEPPLSGPGTARWNVWAGDTVQTSPSLPRGHRGAESRPRAPALPAFHSQAPVCCSRRPDLGAALGEAVEKRNVCGQMCRPRERGERVWGRPCAGL